MSKAKPKDERMKEDRFRKIPSVEQECPEIIEDEYPEVEDREEYIYFWLPQSVEDQYDPVSMEFVDQTAIDPFNLEAVCGF